MEYGGASHRPFRPALALLLAIAFALPGLAACARHKKPSIFSYTNRPHGYTWVAAKAPGTGDTVWYAVDPATRKTLYVGPDGVYYTFDHQPPIQASDLPSKWDPHDVD